MVSLVSSKKTGINIFSHWLLSIVNVLINFFLVGFVITRVGEENYGGWAGIVSIIGYLSLFDAGLSTAVQHYIARFSEMKEEKELISFFGSSVIIYGIVAVLTMLVCFVIANIYPQIFTKVPPLASIECSQALKYVAVGMLFMMLNIPISGTLIGLQQFYLRNISEIISLVIRAVSVFLLFSYWGNSLAYLGLSFLFASIMRFMLCIIFLKLVNPNIGLGLSSINKVSLKRLFSYGGHSAFWFLVTVIIRESGPLIALLMLSPTAASYFYIAAGLVSSFGTFIASPSQVFTPVASSLYMTNQIERLRVAIMRSTRMSCLFSFSLAVVLILYGRDIVYVWAKIKSPEPYHIIIILTIGRISTWIFVNHLAMLKGIHDLWAITIMLAICLVASILLTPILTFFWQENGLAAGLVFPLFIAYAVWMPLRLSNKVQLKVKNILIYSIPIPLFVALIIVLAGLVLNQFWPEESLYPLLLKFLILITLALSLFITIGLDSESRKLICSKIYNSGKNT